MEGLEWFIKLRDELTEPIRKMRKSIGDLTDGLADVKNQNNVTWADMATGINQSLELVNKLSDALSFTDEYNSLRVDVQRYTDLQGQALDDVTNRLYQLKEVYGDEGTQIMAAAQAMTKQNGGTLQENLDIIEAGYQRGGNLNGDMLQQLEEYSTQLKVVGLNNAEGMAVMAQANKMGIYDDKALDAIKEANLSLREMGKTQVDALAGIGVKPEDIQGLTTFDAMKYISQKMQGADSQAQQLVIADIFKGAGEDAGAEFITGLASMQLDLNSIPAVEEAGSGIKAFFADVKGFMANTLGNIGPYVTNLAQLATGVGAVIPLLKGLSLAQIKANIAMLANPIGLIVLGIMALIAAVTVVIMKYDEWGAALTFLMGPLGMIINLIQSVRRNWDLITEAFKSEGIMGGLRMIGKAIFDAILMPVQQVLEIASGLPGKMGKWAKSGAESIEKYRKELGVNTGPTTEPESEETEKSGSPAGSPSLLDFNGLTTNNNSTKQTGAKDTKVGFASAEKKYINVRIEKLVENFNINTQNVKQSSAEIKNMVARAIIDGVRDAEVAI